MTNVTRRTLTKSAAWSVPALAVAAAAPASAASPSANDPLMAYQEQSDTDGTSPISNKPFSASNPELTFNSIIYAEPNGTSDTVTSMRATIYLPVSGLSFTATNHESAALEEGQSAWVMPAGSSGTSEINGATVYAYVFTWSGNVAAVDSFDYEGDTYSLFDYPSLPNLHAQVTGGSVSADMVIKSSLTITTASGQSATRTGDAETVGSFGSNVGDPL